MNSESAINVWTERPKWFGRINIEEYEKLASIGYTPQQIAMYYDIMWVISCSTLRCFAHL